MALFPFSRSPPTHLVRWSLEALDDLDAIETRVALDSPHAAARLRLRLVAAGDSLERHPARGVKVRGGYRKLLAMSPFVIRYVVDGDEVTIVSIRDDRRRGRR